MSNLISIGPENEGKRLDHWLQKLYPQVPYGYWAKACRKGQIRVDGKRVKGNERLQADQMVRLPPKNILQEASILPPPDQRQKDASSSDIKNLESWIIYENSDFVALNKPAGFAVQGGTKIKKHLDGILQVWGEHKGFTPHLVHRLDKDTSGIILIAKNEASARHLCDAFKQHKIYKLYLAITPKVPHPLEGKIDKPLKKEGGIGKEKMRISKEGDRAITLYKVIQQAGKIASLIALAPLTGRTHQLRVHLESLGTPILGDGKYGGKEVLWEGFPKKLHLHAYALLIPQSKGFLFLKATISPHIKQSLDQLGFYQTETFRDAEGFLRGVAKTI
jgi:23S rRNA pseudouridine955/2504/2580 synthase